MNEDFRDLLLALIRSGARFLVVGAHAMALHGVPRATGDLDIWIRPDRSNAIRAWEAIIAFGAPVRSMGLAQDDLAVPGTVIQIGLPPRRVDLLTRLSGLEFDDAWPNRVSVLLDEVEIPFLGRDDLIRNKRAAGRPKDLADLDALGAGGP
ncbi:MAG: hypothetical protein MUF27_06755 [Acidobacteria bacterium]|jgi:hypothetical protein|nr:hypothetical protein [Acidobacteriota bacterium]